MGRRAIWRYGRRVTASTTIAADKAYTFLSVELVGDNYPGVFAGADAATGLGAGGTGGCTISRRWRDGRV